MRRPIALVAGVALAAGLPAQDETPVAKIRSALVFARELQPRETATDPAMLHRLRKDRLAAMIWTAVKEEFCRTRDCTPSETEIAQFQEAMIKQKEQSIREMESQLRGLDSAIARQQPASAQHARLERDRAALAKTLDTLRATAAVFDRRIDAGFVGNWKFFRELHHAYGGRVIFQQAGPEPLDAMRKVLEEQEKLGTFAVYDPALRNAFWQYYTITGHTPMPDGASFLEKPWWLHPRPPRR
jgi:hypothetical protein